jgi:hypothetical protein
MRSASVAGSEAVNALTGPVVTVNGTQLRDDDVQVKHGEQDVPHA